MPLIHCLYDHRLGERFASASDHLYGIARQSELRACATGSPEMQRKQEDEFRNAIMARRGAFICWVHSKNHAPWIEAASRIEQGRIVLTSSGSIPKVPPNHQPPIFAYRAHTGEGARLRLRRFFQNCELAVARDQTSWAEHVVWSLLSVDSLEEEEEGKLDLLYSGVQLYDSGYPPPNIEAVIADARTALKNLARELPPLEFPEVTVLTVLLDAPSVQDPSWRNQMRQHLLELFSGVGHVAS